MSTLSKLRYLFLGLIVLGGVFLGFASNFHKSIATAQARDYRDCAGDPPAYTGPKPTQFWGCVTGVNGQPLQGVTITVDTTVNGDNQTKYFIANTNDKGYYETNIDSAVHNKVMQWHLKADHLLYDYSEPTGSQVGSGEIRVNIAMKTQCSDGKDNDFDTKIDFGTNDYADPGCDSLLDRNEQNTPRSGGGGSGHNTCQSGSDEGECEATIRLEVKNESGLSLNGIPIDISQWDDALKDYKRIQTEVSGKTVTLRFTGDILETYHFTVKRGFTVTNDPRPGANGLYKVVKREKNLPRRDLRGESDPEVVFNASKAYSALFISVHSSYDTWVPGTKVRLQLTSGQPIVKEIPYDQLIIHKEIQSIQGPYEITIVPPPGYVVSPEKAKQTGTLPDYREHTFEIQADCAKTTLNSVLFVSCDPNGVRLLRNNPSHEGLQYITQVVNKIRSGNNASKLLCAIQIANFNDEYLGLYISNDVADHLPGPLHDECLTQGQWKDKIGIVELSTSVIYCIIGSCVDSYNTPNYSRSTIWHELGHNLDNLRGEQIYPDYPEAPYASSVNSLRRGVVPFHKAHAQLVDSNNLRPKIDRLLHNNAYWERNSVEGFAEFYANATYYQTDFDSTLTDYLRTLPNITPLKNLYDRFIEIREGTFS